MTRTAGYATTSSYDVSETIDGEASPVGQSTDRRDVKRGRLSLLPPAVSHDRWTAAQSAELQYWRSLDVAELLRISAEKPAFLHLLGERMQREFFQDKEVLEIGCGPLGLSLASFSRHKEGITRLVKAEPLPRLPICQTAAANEDWAAPFLSWIERLAAEGEYVQTAGEDLRFVGAFDTVITYNVLDHVREPQNILANARRALRAGGRLLVGVDCLSALGRWRFDTITRRFRKGSILVEAHPHTFVPKHVQQMIEEAGFRVTELHGIPGRLRALAGRHTRPAFVALTR